MYVDATPSVLFRWTSPLPCLIRGRRVMCVWADVVYVPAAASAAAALVGFNICDDEKVDGNPFEIISREWCGHHNDCNVNITGIREKFTARSFLRIISVKERGRGGGNAGTREHHRLVESSDLHEIFHRPLLLLLLLLHLNEHRAEALPQWERERERERCIDGHRQIDWREKCSRESRARDDVCTHKPWI